jgi:hypothetical protein
MITINFGPDELRSTDFVGPIVIEDVLVNAGEDDLDPVLKIRIREEASDEEWPGEKPYFCVLEYEYKCGFCNAPNWIQFGTDPSEYRCIKCTDWL